MAGLGADGPGRHMTSPDLGAGTERASIGEGMSFAALSFTLTAAVFAVNAVVTSRIYGVEVIGQYALACAPWLTLISFSTITEQVPFVKRLAVLPIGSRRAGALLVAVLTFSAALTTVMAVPILLLGAVALRGPIHQPGLVLPAVVIVLGYVAIENPSWNLDSVLSGFRAGRELFWARMTQAVSMLVAAVALRPFVPTVWGMTLATLVSFAASFAVRVGFVMRFTTVRLSPAELREAFGELPAILRYAVRLLPGRVAASVTDQAGTWILGAVVPVAGVGAFSRASSLTARLDDVAFRVGEILFPALVEHTNDSNEEAHEQLLVGTLRVVGAVMFLIVATAGGASFGVMQVFGRGFDQAGNVLTILLAAGVVNIVSGLMGYGILAWDRPGLLALISVVQAIIVLALMGATASTFHGEGIAFALLMGGLFNLAAKLMALRRCGLSSGATRALATNLLALCAVTVVGFVAARLVDSALPGVPGTAVAGAAGAAAYAAAAYVFGVVRREEWRQVRRRLPGGS